MRRRAHLPPLELFSLIILLSPAFYLLSSLPSQSFVSFIMCGVVWVTLSSFFFPPDPAASSPPVHRLLSATVAPTQNRACPSSGMCQMSVGSPARVRAPPDNTALTFWTHSKRTAPHKLPVLSRSFAACTWPEMVLVARNASYPLAPPQPRAHPGPVSLAGNCCGGYIAHPSGPPVMISRPQTWATNAIGAAPLPRLPHHPLCGGCWGPGGVLMLGVVDGEGSVGAAMVTPLGAPAGC